MYITMCFCTYSKMQHLSDSERLSSPKFTSHICYSHAEFWFHLPRFCYIYEILPAFYLWCIENLHAHTFFSGASEDIVPLKKNCWQWGLWISSASLVLCHLLNVVLTVCKEIKEEFKMHWCYCIPCCQNSHILTCVARHKTARWQNLFLNFPVNDRWRIWIFFFQGHLCFLNQTSS